jgi:DNA-binding LacI/PurR family transcriptional regulator
MTDAGLDPESMAGDWTEAAGRRAARAARLAGPPDRDRRANDLSPSACWPPRTSSASRPEDLSVVGYDNTVFARLHRCR